MRRSRTDSTTSGVAAFKAAVEQPTWPVEVVDRMGLAEDQARAEIIFSQVMTSRAPADFRAHDSVLAAQLAVTEVHIALVQAEIEATGYTSLGGKNGTAIIKNPLLDVLAFYTNRQIQLARALGLVGVGVDLRTVKNNAKAVNEARDTLGRMEVDSLLAQ